MRKELELLESGFRVEGLGFGVWGLGFRSRVQLYFLPHREPSSPSCQEGKTNRGNNRKKIRHNPSDEHSCFDLFNVFFSAEKKTRQRKKHVRATRICVTVTVTPPRRLSRRAEQLQHVSIAYV